MHDVVVVGAGLAGLAAARGARDAGRGVVVLEARSELGGRLVSRPVVHDAIADLGAEWVGARHTRVHRLAAAAGVRPVRTGFVGAPTRWRADGVDVRRRSPPLSARDVLRLGRVLVRLGLFAREVDAVAPWTSPAAARLDRLSFGAWLESQGVRGTGYELLDTLVGDLVSRPVDELSLLHVVWWVARNGGPVTALQSAFQARLPSGSQLLARHLAAGLDVRTGHRVVRVAQDPAGVTAETASGAQVRAHLAVLAVPAPRLSDLDLEPALPDGQRRLAQELDIGPAAKVAAVLDRLPRRAPRVVLGGQPLTACWRYGNRVTGFARPPHDRSDDAELVAALAAAFDVDEEDLVAPRVQRWADEPTIGGCDVCFRPGQLTELGPWLRRSYGRVVFAGSERSSWPNNMEGALESGEAAARWLLTG